MRLWINILILVTLVLGSGGAASRAIAQQPPATPPITGPSIVVSQAFLPLIARTIMGINGKVSINGVPADDVIMHLHLWNGSTWSVPTFAKTDNFGIYRFTTASSLQEKQKYRVDYSNFIDPAHVNYCVNPNDITSYCAGTDLPGGDFDIANILQVSPPNGQTISLPFTFTWTPRTGVPTDNYVLEIWDNNSTEWWDSGSSGLGYTSQYTLNGFPSGLSAGKAYSWGVGVHQPNGVYCYSYDQEWMVTFAANSNPSRLDIPAPGPSPRQKVGDDR
jgi:hypothetical protein